MEQRFGESGKDRRLDVLSGAHRADLERKARRLTPAGTAVERQPGVPTPGEGGDARRLPEHHLPIGVRRNSLRGPFALCPGIERRVQSLGGKRLQLISVEQSKEVTNKNCEAMLVGDGAVHD